MDRYLFKDGISTYFCTFTVVDWLPLFIKPKFTRITIESLVFCVENKGLKVHGYVIMPNHMHAILSDETSDNQRLHKTITEFRSFSGHELAGLIDNTCPTSWSNILRAAAITDRDRRVWQSGWHAEAVVNQKFFEQKLSYMHNNPVRAGFVNLPEHWTHSSARLWLFGEKGQVPISLDYARL
jgi:REP element-mobilizing transposase RayT